MQTDGDDPEIWSRPCANCGSPVVLEWMKFYSPRCANCGAALKPVYRAERGLAIYFAMGVYGAFLYTYLFFAGVGTLRTVIFFAGCAGSGIVVAAASALCVRGLAAVDEAPLRVQFSLLQALYAMIFIAVMLAAFLRRDDYPQILIAGYVMWGLIEFARYMHLKRPRSPIE